MAKTPPRQQVNVRMSLLEHDSLATIAFLHRVTPSVAAATFIERIGPDDMEEALDVHQTSQQPENTLQLNFRVPVRVVRQLARTSKAHEMSVGGAARVILQHSVAREAALQPNFAALLALRQQVRAQGGLHFGTRIS